MKKKPIWTRNKKTMQFPGILLNASILEELKKVMLNLITLTKPLTYTQNSRKPKLW